MKKITLLFLLLVFCSTLVSCTNKNTTIEHAYEDDSNMSQSSTSSSNNKNTTYTIIWENFDGEILEKDYKVSYGTIPTYDGSTPVKPDDTEYHYTFNGWSPTIYKADKNQTYVAQFSKTAKSSENTPSTKPNENTPSTINNDFVFTSFGAGYALTSYTGTNEKVIIPDYYNEKPVICIFTKCFENNNYIKQIILPKYLTTVKTYSFRNCRKLESIDDNNVENDYELENNIFEGCTNLKHFSISKKISSFTYAFINSHIESIVIEKDITSLQSSYYIINNCPTLKEITINSENIGGDYIYLCDSNTSNVTGVFFSKSCTIISGPLLKGMNKLSELTLPRLDRPITDYFGNAKNYVLDLKLIRGDENISMPEVEHCGPTSTLKRTILVIAEPPAVSQEIDIIYPKEWGLDQKEYWFESNGNYYFINDINNYSFHYSYYNYKVNNIQQEIRYPCQISSNFIVMPKQLKINLLSSLNYYDQYIMNTGYVINFDTVINKDELNPNQFFFGSYPQSIINDDSLKNILSELAKTLPTNSNSYLWTNYGYYINGNVSSYMWYQDITYSGNKYRGVYFTNYRPSKTISGSSTDNSYQYDNGYITSTIYWFKWEPIKWKILKEENGSALIVADLLLDSQDYYWSSSTSSHLHNGGTGYSNNYKLSHIRQWLNDTFYNTAFTSVEKSIIQTTNVDNSLKSTGSQENKYVCDNTNDKVFLLSCSEAKTYLAYFTAQGTEYANSQGLHANYNGTSNWWFRSPYYNGASQVGGVEDSGYFYRDYVYSTKYGVRPAMWINL